MPKKYYGAETEKAIKNFPFSVYRVHKEFIMALVEIKRSAAIANFKAGNFNAEIKAAIVKACDEILSGMHRDNFMLPALQGGAGTSINMNVNEVVAGRANEILEQRGKKLRVHPNDHVNCSQSTNDVNPSAIKIAAQKLKQELQTTLDDLIEALEAKARQFAKVAKLGRTHMQDAVPTTLGAEFAAYAEIIRWHKAKLNSVMHFSQTLNLGGTAIGNSINASPKYIKNVYLELNKLTKLKFKPAKNLMSQTSSQADFLSISQVVTGLCMDCSKIASDLRLLSSGPRGGLGEITLAELQKGSSIMPGKVNPVLPETVNQMYFLVSGNNLAIEHAAHAAQLELGVMFPTIADRLIQSLKISREVLAQFIKSCINKIKANPKRCKELLEASTAYAVLFNPVIGYEATSSVVKEAVFSGRTFREVLLEKGLVTKQKFEQVVGQIKY